MSLQYIRGDEGWVLLTQAQASTVTNISPFTVYLAVSELAPTVNGGIGHIGYALVEGESLPFNTAGMNIWGMTILSENCSVLEYV